MPPNVTRNFSTAGGVTHMECILQLELFSQLGEIGGVGIHIIAIPRLAGTAVAATVMCDHTIPTLAQERHTSVRPSRPR
jgi:hypothetical protein